MKSETWFALLIGAVAVGLVPSRSTAGPPGETDPAAEAATSRPSPDSAKPDAGPASFAPLHAEVHDALAQARQLLVKEPGVAERVLEAARDRVASSRLSDAEKEVLEKRLGPMARIARQRREIERDNQATRDRVRRERQGRVEAGRAVAEGSEYFEELLGKGRFADAEALAWDLDLLSPDTPAVEAMYWKLRFAPYRFDLPFLQLYPHSYVDPFADDYYPYTVPWKNARWRVYGGPYVPYGPPEHKASSGARQKHRVAPRPLPQPEGPGEDDSATYPQPDATLTRTTGAI